MFAGYLRSLPVFGLSDRSKRLIEWPSLKFSKDNSEDWRSRGWVFERNGFLEILIDNKTERSVYVSQFFGRVNLRF